MPEWSEFGEQVNRLVYALAGKKFQADIENTNRFIAERISYSEASLRMMRQGRFRPREEKALEILAEIGCTLAGLDREWAGRLLRSGRHPYAQHVLDRVCPVDAVETAPAPSAASALPVLAIRLAGGLLGSLGALLVWMYGISPVYPAPHELPLWVEGVWGLLLGAGLAVGLLCADILHTREGSAALKAVWLRYALLLGGGLLGALLWHLAAVNLFRSPVEGAVQSTWLETFCFGAAYGLAFAAVVFWAYRFVPPPEHSRWRYAAVPLFAVIVGGFSLLGFLLAKMQPYFANQKDVDLFVGVFLRLGLILTVSALLPGFGVSRENNQNIFCALFFNSK